MTDKIIVEFSRKDLMHPVKDFVKCNLIFALPFKIKEKKCKK